MQETLEQVRSNLEQWVRTHASREKERPCRESILLKDGCLHGYRLCIGSVEAVWIVNSATIEIRRDGRLADRLSLGQAGEETSRAA